MIALRFGLLLAALLLLTNCASKKDTDKIEQRQQNMMIRMG